MKKNNRWLKWVLEDSAKCEHDMPWSRKLRAEDKPRRAAKLPKVKIA